MTFYAYKIFNGSGVSGACEYTCCDGNNNVYGSYPTPDRVTKTSNLTGTTNTNFISTGYNTRGIVVAGSYLFVCDHQNGKLYQYLINDGTSVNNITLSTAKPHGIATDYDGSSENFYLYIAHEDTRILTIIYCVGFTMTSETVFDTNMGATDTSASLKGITYRKVSTYKYVYVTVDSTYIKEVNVTDVSSIPSPVKITVSPVTSSWGITNYNNIFYINGIVNTLYSFTINVSNPVTGSITSLNTGTLIILGGSTAITNDLVSTNSSQHSNTLGISHNVKIYGLDLFIGTSDSNIVKLYGEGGSGIGGDPHIRPLIGKIYTLNNNVQFVKLFENSTNENDNDMVLTIIGENWVLPYQERQKFKSRRDIYKLLKEYTFIKNLIIKYNDRIIVFNMDTLEYTIDSDLSDKITFNEITKVKSMYCIRKAEEIYNENCYQRIIKITNHTFNLTLFITNCLSQRDRNSITINLDTDASITLNNLDRSKFYGGLIFESDDHVISLFKD